MNQAFKTAEDAPRAASSGKFKAHARLRDEVPDHAERARRMRDLIDAPALPLLEIALFLGLPMSTLDKLRAEGKGPPCFKLGRRLYVRQADLRAWLDRMATSEAA